MYNYFYIECPFCHTKSKVWFEYFGETFDCPKCNKQFLCSRSKGIKRAKIADIVAYVAFIIIFIIPAGLFLVKLEEYHGAMGIILTIFGLSILLGISFLLGEEGRKLFSKALNVLFENIYKTIGCITGIPCESEDKQKDSRNLP